MSDVVEAAVQYDATTFDTGTSCLVSQSTQRAGVLSADLECDDQESGPPSEGSISATLSDGDLEVAWLANGERVTVETFDEGVAIRGNDGALRLLWLEGCNADVEASASMATTSWEFGTEAGVCADAPTFEGTDADQPTTVWARSADHDRVDVFHQHAATLPSTLEDGADYALRVSQSLYAFQTGPECYTTTRFLLVALAG